LENHGAVSRGTGGTVASEERHKWNEKRKGSTVRSAMRIAEQSKETKAHPRKTITEKKSACKKKSLTEKVRVSGKLRRRWDANSGAGGGLGKQKPACVKREDGEGKKQKLNEGARGKS